MSTYIENEWKVLPVQIMMNLFLVLYKLHQFFMVKVMHVKQTKNEKSSDMPIDC